MTAEGTHGKGPNAFRTIGEAAEELGVAPHVLRFWEGKFRALRPLKRAGNRRYYRPTDMELLRRIKSLLHDEGFTIKGAQKVLRAPIGADDRVADDSAAPILFATTSATAAEIASDAVGPVQEIVAALDALAEECAIVAAGNPPPTGKD